MANHFPPDTNEGVAVLNSPLRRSGSPFRPLPSLVRRLALPAAIAMTAGVALAGCGQATQQANPPAVQQPAPIVQPPAQQQASGSQSGTTQPQSASTQPSAPATGQAQTSSSGQTETPASTPAAAKEQTIEFVMKDYSFTPDKISVPVGTRLKLVFKNEGERRHDFKIEGLPGEPKIESIGTGGTAELVIDAATAGEYVFFCSVRGHRDRGMHGVLSVR